MEGVSEQVGGNEPENLEEPEDCKEDEEEVRGPENEEDNADVREDTYSKEEGE